MSPTRRDRDETATAAVLRERLARVRKRARRLSRRLETQQQEVSRLRAEIEVLRAWSLDVFPDLAPPDDLERRLGLIRDEGLTYLTGPQLGSLVSCVLEVERAGRPGVLLEAGTARGGSAIAMALAKAPQRELHVHDVFGLIPPPSEEDGPDVAERYAEIVAGRARGRGADEPYYGYRDDLLGEVTASFARHGVPVAEHAVTLHRGLFQDTLVGDAPVALAHVDGDWYESTKVCLERLTPRLVPGGRLVIDDYYNWSGCRRAVDEFFPATPGYRVEYRAKVHVVREHEGPAAA